MTEPTSQTWTVLKLLEWTKGYFAQAQVDSPRIAAEMLLAHVLRCRRIELYTSFDYQPTDDQRNAYRQLVRRAARHEPTAYLIGCKEFYSLRFTVTPAVLIPRPETELLVTQATDYLKALGRAAFMWDACTGSGCVAIATAMQLDDLTVLATDISDDAVTVATGNAAAHGLVGRLRCRKADLLARPTDCDDLPAFDVITANPPYVAEGDQVAPSVTHEPPGALRAGPDGLDVVRPLVADAPGQLAEGGVLILEFGCGQADAVRDLIVATGRLAEPAIIRDHQGVERVAVAARTG